MKPIRSTVIAGAFALLACQLQAASFIVPTDAQMVDRAQAIVIGTPVAQSSGWDDRGPGIVTRYEILVDRVLKGSIEPGSSITITEPGGIAGSVGFVVSGAPEYALGRRALLFLGTDASGRFRTFGLELGLFDFQRDPAGREVLVRGAGNGISGWSADESEWSEPVRGAAGFLEFVDARVRAAEAPAYLLESAGTSKGLQPVQPSALPSAYTLKSGGTPVRWKQFDTGTNEVIYRNGTQTGSSSSTSALADAITAWENPFCDVEMSTTACTSQCKTPAQARSGFDGNTQIIFDVAAVDMPADADAGAVGWGGVWIVATNHSHPVSGESFFEAIEGEIFIKTGSHTQKLLDQLVTHEIGHMLAFRHSNSGTPSSSSAVMKSSIDSAYGAVLQKWDLDAVQTVYGDGACSPEITTQPQSKSITPGQTATMSVVATGTGLSYQWYQGTSGDTSSPIGGATTASYTTPALTATTRYWVRVSTPSCGSVNSNTATITVTTCDPISITQQPADQSILSGQTALLSVRVDGTSPGYQWYRGNRGDTSNPIGGATSRDFTTPALTATTNFWVRISNSCPSSVDSRTVTVTVGPCTQAAITTQPADQTITPGSSTTLSVAATGTSLQYQWYEGTAGDTSKPVGTNAASFTTPALNANTSYWVRITNVCPSSVDSRTAIVTVAVCANVAITTQPEDKTINSGTTATLSVAATGTSPSFQWYEGTAADTSKPVGSNSSSFQTPTLSVTTSYWVRVFNSCPSSSDSRTAVVNVVCQAPASAPTPYGPSSAQPNTPYTIAWSQIAGASSYQIDESTSPAFTNPFTQTITGFSLNFQHAASPSPTPYYYRVRAIADCNGSIGPSSGTVTVYVEAEPVPEPASSSGVDSVVPIGSTDPITFLLTISEPPSSGKIAPASTTFNTSTTQPWIRATPTSGTIPTGGTTVVTVVAVPTGLPPGSNTGTVNVTTPSGQPIATVPVTVTTVAPVSPTPKTGPPDNALIIPAIAHVNLSDKQFVTDVRITNTATQKITYQLTFTPEATNGLTSGKQTSVEVSPGQTVAFNDIVRSSFGIGVTPAEFGGSGALEIRPLNFSGKIGEAALSNLATIATSRTYAVTPNGTFGQFVPGVPVSELAGKGVRLSLQQVAQSTAYRTNLGLVEGSGQPASVQIRVFDANGTKLDDFALDPPLQPAEFRQINRVLQTRGLTMTDGRIELEVTSDTGKITGYASVLDNLTDDPFLVTPVRTGTLSASKFIVPGVADIKIAGLANWRTDARIFNPTDQPVDVTLIFYPDDAPQSPVSKPARINPGAVLPLDNTVEGTFNLTNRKGAMHVVTATPQPLAITARTYDQKSAGTYGQFIPASTLADSIGIGDDELHLLQLEQSVRYRTNVGITEITGNTVNVEIAAWVPGAAAAVILPQTLQPNQALQLNRLLTGMGLEEGYNVRATVRVTGGSGRVLAYASVVDQNVTSQDPTYVPAR